MHRLNNPLLNFLKQYCDILFCLHVSEMCAVSTKLITNKRQIQSDKNDVELVLVDVKQNNRMPSPPSALTAFIFIQIIAICRTVGNTTLRFSSEVGFRVLDHGNRKGDGRDRTDRNLCRRMQGDVYLSSLMSSSNWSTGNDDPSG